MNNKHRNQFGHAIKSNILGEKLSWFLPHVEDRTTPLTPREFRQLIETYLQRFDEEIEQIKLKQSISKNRANQHVSRLNVIKFTLEREKDEFNGGGMGEKAQNQINTFSSSTHFEYLQIPNKFFFLLRTPQFMRHGETEITSTMGRERD